MDEKLNALFFRRISLLCLFSSIIISLLSTFLNSIIGGIVGITLLIIYIIISIIFWRCPFCKKRLPMRFDTNNVDEVLCPYCDANLLYGEKKK